MRTIKLLFSIAFLFFLNIDHSFSQLQLGLIGSMQYGNLEHNNERLIQDSNEIFGIGIMSRKSIDSLHFFSVDFSYQKFGWYAVNVEDGADLYNVSWNNRVLSTSVYLGRVLLRKPKLKFASSLGLNLDKAVSRNKVIYSEDPNVQIDQVASNSVSLQITLDLEFKIANGFSMLFRPELIHYIYSFKKNYHYRNLGFSISLLKEINAN